MPEATHSETVAEQIAELRRQNQELARRLRLLTRGVAATAIVGLLMIAAGARRNVEVPKSIEAERFAVRDAEGKVRMELAVREDGSSGIDIFDPDGRKRIGLTVTKQGAVGLGLRDANDEQLVSLDLVEENGARLVLRDPKHRNNVVLRSMPTDDAFIGILGPKDELLNQMSTTSKGRSTLLVRNRDQSGTCVLGVDADGTRQLALDKGLDQPRFLLGSDDRGSGLRFWDFKDKVSVLMGTSDVDLPILQMSHKGETRVLLGMPEEAHAGLVVFGPKFPQVMNLTYDDGKAGLVIRDERGSHLFPKEE